MTEYINFTQQQLKQIQIDDPYQDKYPDKDPYRKASKVAA